MAANLMDVINSLDIEELRKIRDGARDLNILSNFKEHCDKLEVGDITNDPSEERLLLEKLDLLLEIYQQDNAVVEILSGIKNEILTPALYDILVQTSELVDTSERSEASSESIRPFEAFEKHVSKRIAGKNNQNACDLKLIFLKDDAPLSVSEQESAKNTNMPILVNRPSGWSIYGYVDRKWRERTLDNLTAEEQKLLERIAPQETQINKKEFPFQLLPRLKESHTYSNQMDRANLEFVIERSLTIDQDDTSSLDEQYGRVMDKEIKDSLDSLSRDVLNIVQDKSLSFADKVQEIYSLYKAYKETLKSLGENYLYPVNAPSIENLKIDVQGELFETYGEYIRAKNAEIDHFNDNFIKIRLIASYLKGCMQYVNTKTLLKMKQLQTEQPDLRLVMEELRNAIFLISEPSSTDSIEIMLSKMSKKVADNKEMLSDQLTEKNKFLNRKIAELKKLDPKDKKLAGSFKKMADGSIETLEKEIDSLQKNDKFNVDVKKKIQEIKKTISEVKELMAQKDQFIGIEDSFNPKDEKKTPVSQEPKKKSVFDFFTRSKSVAASTASAPAPVAASIAPAVASTASAPAPVAASASSTPVSSMASGPVMWNARRSQVSQSPSPVAAQHRSSSSASPIPPVVPANAESQQSAPENAIIESPRGNVAKK